MSLTTFLGVKIAKVKDIKGRLVYVTNTSNVPKKTLLQAKGDILVHLSKGKVSVLKLNEVRKNAGKIKTKSQLNSLIKKLNTTKAPAKKTATKKNKCAVELGKKGGKTAVARKVGVHSSTYKKKVVKKKPVAKTKKPTSEAVRIANLSIKHNYGKKDKAIKELQESIKKYKASPAFKTSKKAKERVSNYRKALRILKSRK